MASINPTKVIEACHVTPSSRSPEPGIELSLPLTSFDLFWLRFPPVERIYFYNLTELTPAMFNTVILPKLKHSLSLTLVHFLPLAGNVTWPPHAVKPNILYSTPNDGISVTVAQSKADFDILSSNEMHDAFMSHPYVPKLSTSDTKVSVIALQITLFPNKGFSIGYAINHAVLDGKSIIMFMKAWAHICKHNTSLLPAELSPLFDRTVVLDIEGVDKEYLDILIKYPVVGLDSTNGTSLTPISIPEAPPSSVRATFPFSREDLERLKERVLSQCEKERKPIHLSSFVLSSAYTYVCMVKARGLKSDEKVGFGFLADCRARLDPPLPTNYFGNCVCPNLVNFVGGDFGEDKEIAFVAQKLGEKVNRLKKGALEGVKDRGSKPKDMKVVGVAGSSQFEVYGVDFGWGRPKHVEVISIDRTGSISMGQSKDGSGGVEIGLVLKKHEMEIFETLFVEGLKDN